MPERQKLPGEALLTTWLTMREMFRLKLVAARAEGSTATAEEITRLSEGYRNAGERVKFYQSKVDEAKARLGLDTDS